MLLLVFFVAQAQALLPAPAQAIHLRRATLSIASSPLGERPRALAGRRASAVRASGNDEDEERGEALQFLAIFAGIGGGSYALFAALTTLGLQDTEAGSVLLVFLVAIGSYLLFDEETQAALQAQAVQQVASDEESVVDAAPLQVEKSRAGLPAAELAEDSSAASAELSALGLVRVDGVLGEATCGALLDHVNANLEKSIDLVRAGGNESQYFGQVLSRSRRYDLMLDLEPPVRGALDEALASIRPVIAKSLGEDAELFELAALISDPGAPRQPLHPDTGFSLDPSVMTAFLALQPIDDAMGPTLFLPRTHTRDAHARFNADPQKKAELLRSSSRRLGLLGKGDVSLFDSRLIHAGGENRSPRRRVLWYFSFKAKLVRGVAPGTLLEPLRGKYSLAEL